MQTRPLVPGWCLMCSNTGPVLWIGPVEHDGQSAPAYICEDCCQRIREYVDFYNRQRDSRPAVRIHQSER